MLNKNFQVLVKIINMATNWPLTEMMKLYLCMQWRSWLYQKHQMKFFWFLIEKKKVNAFWSFMYLNLEIWTNQ